MLRSIVEIRTLFLIFVFHFYALRMKSFPILLLYFALLMASLATAQTNNDKIRAGSALALKGKIYVLAAFITTPDKAWSKEDKNTMYQQVNEALTWLTKQAAQYGVDISFEKGTYGYESDLTVNTIESGTGSGKERVDWVGVVLKTVGYKTPMDFYRWAVREKGCDNVLVLVMANQGGRSYAIPFSKGLDEEKYFLEGCMLYRTRANGDKLISATVAHEMLHTFGGWDLYETFQQTKENELLAKTMYPDDIMLRVSYNIDDLKIDKLTAWLVGLPSKEEVVFWTFKPFK